ncbi:hypothetical protein G3A1_054 [Escherichia phage vB_EcoP-G3A1]|uniref:Uncharacterized protein n=2 Tax=Rodentiumvirus TaxID=3424936 RepID=A0AAE7XT32_9CAUD|nr:hypothetical protein 101117UKE2_054 [Escherichia phage vB_EcoP-101117UKE2]QZI79680.1 hypothetical protein 101118B1_055 [Escherichia phage vB_EcoP-101118B1]QZI81283.1 hypothetical protein G3A1_054 [Escherichia phage vB_EcoP-G3A1]
MYAVVNYLLNEGLTMTLNNRELSVLFTMLCYMIRNNELLTDDELALYHRFLNEGWTDTVNQYRNMIDELREGK